MRSAVILSHAALFFMLALATSAYAEGWVLWVNEGSVARWRRLGVFDTGFKCYECFRHTVRAARRPPVTPRTLTAVLAGVLTAGCASASGTAGI